MSDNAPEGGAVRVGNTDADLGDPEQRAAWQPGRRPSDQDRADDLDPREEDRPSPAEPQGPGVAPIAAAHGGSDPADPGDAPVFTPESAADFTSRWTAIKAGFVDDPRHAIEDADRFVAEVARAFASGVESRHHTLTSAREPDGHGQTEELRLAMQRYRVLVDQLLR